MDVSSELAKLSKTNNKQQTNKAAEGATNAPKVQTEQTIKTVQDVHNLCKNKGAEYVALLDKSVTNKEVYAIAFKACEEASTNDKCFQDVDDYNKMNEFTLNYSDYRKKL